MITLDLKNIAFVFFIFLASTAQANQVAIVGGGIAGTTAAILLAKNGVTVDFYEKNPRIFSESSKIPAHLYTGVMYFNLGKKTVQHCMEDALQFASHLPFIINPRPTVAAIALDDERDPHDMIEACEMNKEIYAKAVESNLVPAIFGPPSDFCQIFTREDLEILKETNEGTPSINPWMVSFAKHTQLISLKYPVLLMQEYGLDMRFAAGYFEELVHEEVSRGTLHFYPSSTVVKASIDIDQNQISIDVENDQGLIETRWYSLLIDASGRNLGQLEHHLGISESRLADVKVAGIFLSKPAMDSQWPMPSTYILGGLGTHPTTNEKYQSFMSQLSPVNPSNSDGTSIGNTYIVTITNTDCTYIAGGKVSNEGRKSPDLSRCKEAAAILSGEQCCKHRLHSMKKFLSRRHPMADEFIPLGYLTGSVDILGEKPDARDSSLQIHRDLRYITVNLTKAGASVRLAQEILEELTRYGKKYYDVEVSPEKAVDPFKPHAINNANQRALFRFEADGFPVGTRSTYYEPNLEVFDTSVKSRKSNEFYPLESLQ